MISLIAFFILKRPFFLSSSVGIINNIDPALLSNVLLVIVKRLISEEQHSSQIFHDEEKLKLKEVLSLPDDSCFEMVLSTLLYIIRQVSDIYNTDTMTLIQHLFHSDY